MKTKTNSKKTNSFYYRYYPGLYPPGAFIAWPNSKVDSGTKYEMPYRRTKTGGYIAMPLRTS